MPAAPQRSHGAGPTPATTVRPGRRATRRTQATSATSGCRAITALPCANHHSPNWEPEPFRYIGVHYVQHVYWKLDQKAQRTGKAPTGKSLAERWTRH